MFAPYIGSPENKYTFPPQARKPLKAAMDPVLLIFIALAAFVVFRLISVLGTRTGHEQQHDIEGLQRAARSEASSSEAERGEAGAEADAPSEEPVSDAARALREADPLFNEKEYLAGARGAYEMIVEAFAAGDLKSIRDFLSASVFETFKRAVEQRAEKGLTTDLKFVGIENAAIEKSEVRDGAMFATTSFASNQVRATRDSNGDVVEGDPNRIDLVKDRWTFSRKINSRDPNWILIATGGA